ncbi:MAG TPA: class I SAM-dependent methyltransferase [Pirellulales bacterium]|nr:class I SAM-dependent methyltransferase [Pirellulales bacterium]
MQSEQFQLHAQIEQRHWWFVARRRILRDVIRKIAPPGSSPLDDRWRLHRRLTMGEAVKAIESRPMVVDIGCGTGANLAALADEYRCLGVDTSAEAVELARQRFLGVTFVCGFAPQDVKHRLNRAAVVMLTDVLEHVADDRDLLASIVDACPPGAQILITVPADMRLWSPHDEAFGHYRRYDAQSLAAVWTGLPVNPRLLSHFNSRLYPLIRGIRAMNRWRGRTSGAANTDFTLPAPPINSALEACFAGERRRLIGAIDGASAGYRRGVSLIAILQREAVPQSKTTTLNPIVLSGNAADLAASVISAPAAL